MRLARVYEDSAPGDGQRVLVDRLWPRRAELAEAVELSHLLVLEQVVEER